MGFKSLWYLHRRLGEQYTSDSDILVIGLQTSCFSIFWVKFSCYVNYNIHLGNITSVLCSNNVLLLFQGLCSGTWPRARSLPVDPPHPASTARPARATRPARQAVQTAAPRWRLLQGLHTVELPPVSRHPGQFSHPLEQREHVEALPSLVRVATDESFAKVSISYSVRLRVYKCREEPPYYSHKIVPALDVC